MLVSTREQFLRKSGMLIKFKVAGADKTVWINPEHVSGLLATSHEISTVYLVGGVEQRIDARPEDVAKAIEEAQHRLAKDRSASA